MVCKNTQLCLLFNIFAYGMHMHMKLKNTFGNWLIGSLQPVSEKVNKQA